jgi:hypothetical protein
MVACWLPVGGPSVNAFHAQRTCCLRHQGFATGDLEADAYAPRYFVERGLEIMTSQSYSKNLGLYGERIGALSLVLSDKEVRCKAPFRRQLVFAYKDCSGGVEQRDTDTGCLGLQCPRQIAHIGIMGTSRRPCSRWQTRASSYLICTLWTLCSPYDCTWP